MDTNLMKLLSAAQAPVWCPWCGGHMTGWGWFMMMLFWLLILVLAAVAVWALLQRGGAGVFRGAREDRAETTLRERYARGEIDEETYRRMRDELRRDGT